MPNTFVATPNAALYTGALPCFVDVDGETGAMDPSGLEGALLREEGVRAVVPVHYGGAPLDMESICGAALSSGAIILEDACHALGARRRDSTGVWRTVGGCEFSDMTAFSFHPVKSITTGEGGAVTTNDRVLWRRMRELLSLIHI